MDISFVRSPDNISIEIFKNLRHLEPGVVAIAEAFGGIKQMYGREGG